MFICSKWRVKLDGLNAGPTLLAIKKQLLVLTGVGTSLQTERSLVQFLVGAHAWGCRPGAWLRV